MKRITLTFTSDQLRELAKQLYLGSFITLARDYKKENFAMVIMNKVCRAGFLEAPETGAFARPVNNDEPPFYISRELDDECSPLVEAYKKIYFDHYLFLEFLNREVLERFGKPFNINLLLDPSIGEEVLAFVTKLEKEYETNGFTNFRYVEPT